VQAVIKTLLICFKMAAITRTGIDCHSVNQMRELLGMVRVSRRFFRRWKTVKVPPTSELTIVHWMRRSSITRCLSSRRDLRSDPHLWSWRTTQANTRLRTETWVISTQVTQWAHSTRVVALSTTAILLTTKWLRKTWPELMLTSRLQRWSRLRKV